MYFTFYMDFSKHILSMRVRIKILLFLIYSYYYKCIFYVVIYQRIYIIALYRLNYLSALTNTLI